MANNVKIHLKGSRIRSLTFSINNSYSHKDSEKKIDVHTDLKFKSDYDYKNKSINCVFLIKIGGDDFPFELLMEYEGLFGLNKRTSKRDADPICEINCPAILFPFLRECVAEITRRAGFAPLLLPSINFVKAKEDRLEREAGEK